MLHIEGGKAKLLPSAGQGGGRTNKGSHTFRASQRQHVNAEVHAQGVSKPSNMKQRARVWEGRASKPQQKNKRKSKNSSRRGVHTLSSTAAAMQLVNDVATSPPPTPAPRKRRNLQNHLISTRLHLRRYMKSLDCLGGAKMFLHSKNLLHFCFPKAESINDPGSGLSSLR